MIDFGKVAWTIEEATRILETEELLAEAAWIKANYVADAIERRDAATVNGRVLEGAKLVNQLVQNDTLDKDGFNENYINNCGPATLTFIINMLTGVWIKPDTIKDTVKGQDFTGYTNVNPDLSGYLQRQASIPVKVYYDGLPHNIKQVIIDSINQGWPVCVLHSSPIGVGGRLANHFAAAYGYTPNEVILADPWGGVKKVTPWADFERRYLRWCIVCQRSRSSGISVAGIMEDLDSLPEGGQAGPGLEDGN